MFFNYNKFSKYQYFTFNVMLIKIISLIPHIIIISIVFIIIEIKGAFFIILYICEYINNVNMYIC